MTELEKAALMLSVANDLIFRVTGGQVKRVLDSEKFRVLIYDSSTFDQLAENRNVIVAPSGGEPFPLEYSFELHGIKFFSLRKYSREDKK